jgi:hypothetical protein
MRIIEQNCHGTEFAVWIDKTEKDLLEAYAKMKKLNNDDATLLLVNPDTFFGFNCETGKAVTLEFKEWRDLYE